MFLNVIDPVGTLTSLDLGAAESWQLGVLAFPGNPVEAPDRKNMLGLVFRYVVAGTMAKVTVAAFDTDTEHEAEQVAAVGLPMVTRDGNIDRVREAMKVIINAEGQTQATMTAMNGQATKLVNLYHDLLLALFAQGASPLTTLNLPLAGQFEDQKRLYRYALTMHRNQPWLREVEGNASGGGQANPTLGLGPPPGVAGAPPPVSKGGRHPAGKGKGKSGGQEPETLGPPSAVAADLPPLGAP